MTLFFVTGISGAGKTAVCNELKVRGYSAYDTDEDLLSRWCDKNSGNIVEPPSRDIVKTPSWRDKHEFRIIRECIIEIGKAAGSKTVFICGTAANEAEVWDCFATVFYLAIDEQTLRQRISTRTGNSFGKEPHELAIILEWHRYIEQNRSKYGANMIDATLPLNLVVDTILKSISNPLSSGR